jgi:hypothetical protein
MDGKRGRDAIETNQSKRETPYSALSFIVLLALPLLNSLLIFAWGWLFFKGSLVFVTTNTNTTPTYLISFVLLSTIYIFKHFIFFFTLFFSHQKENNLDNCNVVFLPSFSKKKDGKLLINVWRG